MKTLISEAEIKKRVAELGSEINAHYSKLLKDGEDVVVVGVLKGCFVFLSDLVRELDFSCLVDFVQLSSYGSGTQTSGEVRLKRDLTTPIEGRHVLIVEDIVDTGLTMQRLFDLLYTRKPLSIKLCSFSHKPSRSEVSTNIDFLGFTIEDHFVVGYGLDFDERFRQLKELQIYQS